MVLAGGAGSRMRPLTSESVILHDAVIRAGSRVDRVIVDAGAEVGAGAHVRSTDPAQPVEIVART